MGGDAFVRSSRFMRVSGAIFLLGAVSATLVGLSSASRRPSMLLLGTAVGLLFGFVGVSLAFMKWRVGDDGLERLTPLRARLFIPWGDVTFVGESVDGGILVRRGLDHPVLVSHMLLGLNDLRRRVLERAPVAAVSEETRDVFLGHIERARIHDPPPEVAPTSGPYRQGPSDREAAAPVARKDDPAARWRENPFFVLGLPPECTRADVERTGQKLLALLAIDSGPARRFTTPLGEGARTPDRVRAAMAELRDPERRLVHEMWARVAPVGTLASPPDAPGELRPWPEARLAIGWRVS
jgi:hypothetical protein